MAEGFAKKYGADVLSVESAGLAPAGIIVPETHQAMREKNIALEGQFPKSFHLLNPADFDVIVNMSGSKLPKESATHFETWPVRDPIGLGEDVFRRVRDDIEQRVMRLILEQRQKQSLSTR